MASKRGLGKGLDTLIPKTEEEITESIEGVGALVDINLVEPNRSQPRKNFEEDALNELADSIKQIGIINPLLVQKKDGYYEIIAGERRWRASKLAGLKEVPVIIKELGEQDILALSLIENIQREDLNPIEEATAYKRLFDEFNLKQDEVAELVSKSRSAIANSMRLLNLDARVQQMLIEDKIKEGHARAILSLSDKEEQFRFAERVFDERMSVRDVEKALKEAKKEKKEKSKSKLDKQTDAVLSELEDSLKNIFGTKVKINAKDGEKGSIEIEYYSKEQLSEIIDRLQA